MGGYGVAEIAGAVRAVATVAGAARVTQRVARLRWIEVVEQRL